MRKKIRCFKGSATVLSLLFSAISVSVAAQESVVTDGNGIRNVINADIAGKEMLYISEIDSSVALYTAEGKKVWSKSVENSGLNFEIVAAEITGDSEDDLLLANGNGSVYAFSSKGELLWQYTPDTKVRLSEVAVVGKGKNAKIFTGGNNFILYEVDANGKELSQTAIKGTVRKIESGNFIDKDKESLFVFTYEHDKYRSSFFGYIDPTTKEIVKSGSISDVYKGGIMVQDLKVSDLNNDGKDDLLFSGASGGAICFGMDGNLKPIFTFEATREDSQRYAYGKSVSLTPYRDEIIVQYGGVIYLINNRGEFLSKSGAPYRGIIYNDLVFLSDTKKLIGAGQIGGDNSLYYYDLTDSKWSRTEQQIAGRQLEVVENVETLYNQALNFERPSYQKKSDKSYRMMLGAAIIEDDQVHWVETKSDPKMSWLDSNVAKLDGGNLDIITEYIVTENYDRTALVASLGEIALRKDTRKPYTLTQKQIVDWAAEQEKNGNNFSIWAGHGSDPLFMDITTLEKIVEVAPTCCYGFLYAEMQNTEDNRVKYFVETCVPRLATAIRKNKSNAKLYFRYKNMFWAADCHTDLWRKMFFSGEYADILVPSAEDTNNRLQDSNFSGRVGMFASGYVDDYAMRLVDDNPTSWRPLSPGGQRSVSPYLRNAALMMAYGCRYGVLFDINYFEEPGYNALFALMKSGVLPVVDKEDILSIGSWHLMGDVDVEYHESNINNGHDLTPYLEEDNNKVFSNAGVHWCGATVPEYDYSKMMGVDYRWLNFMPTMPNGMIPITDKDYEPILKKNKADYCMSNVSVGYIKGKEVEAKEFGSYMKNIVEKGAKKMIMRVEGASWGLIKIDDTHARLVLVDSGYIDPKDNKATIYFQTKKPISGIDILTKEKFSTQNSDKLEVVVPAGTMRFIDFEYSDSL
ncbi:MAG: hypothetical protein R3Y50_05345 [Rikenellaceae bacterium]